MKYNTKPLSGTAELLPPEQAHFNYLYSNLTQTFWQAGYHHIVTPILNRTDTLLAKAGGETEKQIYRVFKTDEDPQDSTQALRFDHTVPLARYVVEHNNDLVFPFKVCQVDRNFRGERAQHGRLREFYQCDIDVVGRGDLPIAYDADVIYTLSQALASILTLQCEMQISNRKLLTGLLEELDLQEQTSEILHIIDRAPKVNLEQTVSALKELGVKSDDVVKITTFMTIKGERAVVMPKLQKMHCDNQTFVSGMSELDQVLKNLEQTLDSDQQVKCIASLAIVRGLDYYTGTIFETVVTEHPEYGSVCGGGRYDNLCGYYTNQVFPGVGGSIGLSRLFATLQPTDFVQPDTAQSVDLVIAPISDAEFMAATKLASELRAEGLAVDVMFAGKKLGDRLTYATKIAPAVIVVGEDEAKSQSFKVKDFATGKEMPLEEYLKD